MPDTAAVPPDDWPTRGAAGAPPTEAPPAAAPAPAPALPSWVWRSGTSSSASRSPCCPTVIPGEAVMPGYVTTIYGAQRPMDVAVNAAGDRIYIGETAGDNTARVFDAQGTGAGAAAAARVHRLGPRAGLPGGQPGHERGLCLRPADGARSTSTTQQGRTSGPSSRRRRLEGWQPLGMAFDATGNLYVTDVGSTPNRVRVFDPAGKVLRTIGRGRGLTFPNGVAVDAAGYVVRDRQQQRPAPGLRRAGRLLRGARSAGASGDGQPGPAPRRGRATRAAGLRRGHQRPDGLRLRPRSRKAPTASTTWAPSGPRASRTAPSPTPTASRSTAGGGSTSPTRPTTACSCGATETNDRGRWDPRPAAQPPMRRPRVKSHVVDRERR